MEEVYEVDGFMKLMGLWVYGVDTLGSPFNYQPYKLYKPHQPINLINPSTSSILTNPTQLKHTKSNNMYKYLLQSVDGIEWFGISTLLIFFGTFCVASIRAFISRKEEMQHMANLPLED